MKNWKKSLPIFSFLKPYKFTYGIGLICLLISSLTAMIFPYLLGNLLGADVNQQQNEFQISDPNNINALLLLLMVLFATQAFLVFLEFIFLELLQKKHYMILEKQLLKNFYHFQFHTMIKTKLEFCKVESHLIFYF